MCQYKPTKTNMITGMLAQNIMIMIHLFKQTWSKTHLFKYMIYHVVRSIHMCVIPFVGALKK